MYKSAAKYDATSFCNDPKPVGSGFRLSGNLYLQRKKNLAKRTTVIGKSPLYENEYCLSKKGSPPIFSKRRTIARGFLRMLCKLRIRVLVQLILVFLKVLSTAQNYRIIMSFELIISVLRISIHIIGGGLYD